MCEPTLACTGSQNRELNRPSGRQTHGGSRLRRRTSECAPGAAGPRQWAPLPTLPTVGVGSRSKPFLGGRYARRHRRTKSRLSYQQMHTSTSRCGPPSESAVTVKAPVIQRISIATIWRELSRAGPRMLPRSVSRNIFWQVSNRQRISNQSRSGRSDDRSSLSPDR